MNKRWRPSVTVAAVIEHEGRFLLVEEHTPEGLRLNNPAGHLEPGETPQAAVVREALEETGREFVPEALLGVYLARFVRARPPRAARAGHAPLAEAQGGPRPPEDITYLRLAYSGRVGDPLPGRALDPAIVRTLWLTRDEIAADAARLRSPLVMRCIDDHLAGRRLPLDTVFGDESLAAPVPLQPLERAPAPPGGEGVPGGAAASRSARRRARKRMQGMQEQHTEVLAAPDRPSGEMPADGTPGVQGEAEPGPAAPPGSAPPGSADRDAEAGPPAALAPQPAQAAQAASAEDAVGAAEPADAAAPATHDTPDIPQRPERPAAARPEPTWAETAAALAERFPALFSPGEARPIKLRIQADIQARTQGAFTRKQLSIFLHRHTTSTAYLRALVASPQRFDLDGQPAGDVAPEHVEAAKEELERRRQIVAQRRAQQGPRPGRAAAMRQAPEGSAEVPPEGAGTDGASATDRPSPPRPARADRPNRPDRPGRPGGPDRGPRPAAGGQAGRPPRGDRGAPPAAAGGRLPRPERGDRPAGDRPPGRPFDRSSDRPAERLGSRSGPPGAPRAEHGDRGHDRRPDRGFARRGESDRAEAAIALPQDPAHRERAMLLRSFEGSPLTAANYCALKGLALAEFEAQIALARREREERQRAGAGGA